MSNNQNGWGKYVLPTIGIIAVAAAAAVHFGAISADNVSIALFCLLTSTPLIIIIMRVVDWLFDLITSFSATRIISVLAALLAIGYILYEFVSSVYAKNETDGIGLMLFIPFVIIILAVIFCNLF